MNDPNTEPQVSPHTQELLKARVKVQELWHLIAMLVQDERAATVPEQLFRDAATYRAAYPPDNEWNIRALLPGPERDAVLRGPVSAVSAEDAEAELARLRPQIEAARKLFRAVVAIVDPYDREKEEAALREAHESPGPGISEILDQLERELNPPRERAA